MSLVAVACALFSIGLYGVLSRRDIVAILASVEVMLGGALVLLVGLGAGLPGGPLALEGVALLVIVVVAAEAAVGLTLLVALARRSRRTRIDEVTEVRG
jgi:NADH:ubiquinone oxidoreductase subunit K